MNTKTRWLAVAAAAALSLVPASTRAHCDTLDGPVVATARRALQAKDVRPVLAWVKPGGEPEVRSAFFRALVARNKAQPVRDAAELAFFETVVRVHRAGEGAPFTGLKPAGAPVPEAVRAADTAVEGAGTSALERQLVDAIRHGLGERLARLRAREAPGKDVAAGRAWVEAYVDYVHYVERLDTAARGGAHHGDGEVEVTGVAAASESVAAGEPSPPHAH